MSFRKINDPAERARIVEEFLKRKKNIQQNINIKRKTQNTKRKNTKHKRKT